MNKEGGEDPVELGKGVRSLTHEELIQHTCGLYAVKTSDKKHRR